MFKQEKPSVRMNALNRGQEGMKLGTVIIIIDKWTSSYRKSG